MKLVVRLAAAALATAAALPASAQFTINKLWSYNHNAATPGRSSEIVTFDGGTQALWVVGGSGLEVLNLDGTVRSAIATSAFGTVNSIAIRGDVAAVSFSNPAGIANPGTVQFFKTTDFIGGSTPTSLGGITVGAVPDMVTWTPDGRLLVANEGERQSNAVNPAGSVSIVNFGAPVTSANVQQAITNSTAQTTTAGFDGVPLVGDVRLQQGVSASVGLEPEYIALNADGTRAMVTLQEANALGILNLQTQQFESVVALGLKSFAAPGAKLDPSDRDGAGNTPLFAPATLRNGPIKGMYMPDGIASFVKDGKTFYVTANEGDFLIDNADRVRISDIADARFDPAVFGTAADIAALKATFGRLRVSSLEWTSPNSTISELRAVGGRSFSIWNDKGELVSDSGDTIESMLALMMPQLYDDGRSPDKGVEPEGIAIKQVGGRIYAFVGLERTLKTVIAVFDITDPTNPKFMQFIVGDQGELAPEGLILFEANNFLYLAVAQEDPSHITSLYQLTEVPEPSTYALMLAGLAGLFGVARRRTARVAAAA